MFHHISYGHGRHVVAGVVRALRGASEFDLTTAVRCGPVQKLRRVLRKCVVLRDVGKLYSYVCFLRYNSRSKHKCEKSEG